MSTKPQLLADDVLEAMLAETAEAIAVPAKGAHDALAAARHAERDRPVRTHASGWWHPGRLLAAGGALAAVVLLGVAISNVHPSSSGGSDKSAAAAAPAVASVAGSATGPAEAAAGAASSGSSGPESAPKAAPVDPSNASVGTTGGASIVRTGNATIVVRKGGVASAVSQLEGAATGLDGYLQDSSVASSTATVTLRVPGGSFEALLARLPAIGKVTASSSSSTDVTGQTVDLAARLKAAQATRETYLTLLSRASSIGDILSVQQRIDDLQTEIEQLQGQQKTLAAQAQDATLAVSVGEPGITAPPAPKPTPPRTGFNLAIHQAFDSFRNGLEDVVAASGGLALFVIFLLVLVPFVKVGMRFYRRSLL